MADVVTEVLDALRGLGVAFDLIEHEPASSIEACAPLSARLNAPILKNLFLTTRRRGGYYLLVMRPYAPFRSGEVSAQAGSSRLCFAPEEPLDALLREKPGSISPMGLLFDRKNEVTLLMDSALREETRLAFHPCRNTHSLALATEDFLTKFLPAVHHEPKWIDIDA
ncbi:MAG: prolyl-tRNA synthetase associated domain-containing protein [Clostridia bacterium]|nr:prolyl-tRNA synthetase associated domain-containing protein [Clostridia bacterium]